MSFGDKANPMQHTASDNWDEKREPTYSENRRQGKDAHDSAKEYGMNMHGSVVSIKDLPAHEEVV